MPGSKIREIMDEQLISPADLAEASSLSDRTIRNMLAGRHKARIKTRRACLHGLNAILKSMGKDAVGPEVFS